MKFYEIILKYYRLNSFQDIVIGFNYGLQMTSQSTAELSDGHLV